MLPVKLACSPLKSRLRLMQSNVESSQRRMTAEGCNFLPVNAVKVRLLEPENQSMEKRADASKVSGLADSDSL